MTQPGIKGNSDPHWRMTFSVNAVEKIGKKRPTGLKLESSQIYEAKGRKHFPPQRFLRRSVCGKLVRVSATDLLRYVKGGWPQCCGGVMVDLMPTA